MEKHSYSFYAIIIKTVYFAVQFVSITYWSQNGISVLEIRHLTMTVFQTYFNYFHFLLGWVGLVHLPSLSCLFKA